MLKKKILFSISYYLPYVSGLTICAQRVADDLSVDNEVNILCNRHNKSLEENEKNIWRANPLFRIGKGFVSIDWIAKSWFLTKQSDVVVINLPQFEGFITALIAKMFRKKVFSIVHCEATIKNKFVQAVLDAANIFSMLLSDRVIVYTMDYAENSRWVKYFKNKLVEIYPPIPIIKAKGKKHRPRKNEVVLGVAARLSEEKGIEYLLEAMDILGKETKLMVAGPINPVGEERYRQKIAGLIGKLGDRVAFLGNLDQRSLAEFYKKIDVLVLPSVNSTEAFGMVQVEAMMQGTPVVASNLPGVRIPILRTGMGELCEPKNPKSIAEAIKKTAQKRYKKGAEKIFNPKKSYEKYRSVLFS